MAYKLKQKASPALLRSRRAKIKGPRPIYLDLNPNKVGHHLGVGYATALVMLLLMIVSLGVYGRRTNRPTRMQRTQMKKNTVKTPEIAPNEAGRGFYTPADRRILENAFLHS